MKRENDPSLRPVEDFAPSCSFFRVVLDKTRPIPTIFPALVISTSDLQPPSTQKNMDTYVPLISSGPAGPLGVLHLPRFWQKASLEARGKLDKRYPGCGKGYDQMTL